MSPGFLMTPTRPVLSHTRLSFDSISLNTRNDSRPASVFEFHRQGFLSHVSTVLSTRTETQTTDSWAPNHCKACTAKTVINFNHTREERTGTAVGASGRCKKKKKEGVGRGEFVCVSSVSRKGAGNDSLQSSPKYRRRS